MINEKIQFLLDNSKEAISALSERAKYHQKIAGAVLIYSKYKAKRVKLNLSAFDPIKIIDKAIKIVMSEITKREIKLYKRTILAQYSY